MNILYRFGGTALVALFLVSCSSPSTDEADGALDNLDAGPQEVAETPQGVQDGQWPNYGGDLGSTKYSSADQINKDNVKDLAVAWRWESPDAAIVGDDRRKNPGSYKATPIMVDGTLYAVSGFSIVVALNPETGEEKWRYDPKVHEGGRPTNLGFNTRGLCYWTDGEGDERIIFATNRAKLYSLNAKTGELVASFGDNGILNMPDQYRRKVDARVMSNVAPPLVINDTVVLGMVIFDGPTMKEMPPGDVHAFDVRTGAKKWAFKNPPEEGQLGHDTWKNGSAEYSGNANVWTMMSADPELNLVYLPFGTPTNDWYGGHRLGDNLFAESIVAVNADTGEYVWHFQHVHHGLWDYDIPCAPALTDIEVNGKKIKALAQLTKQGFLWVLDRTNGEPVWPVEEREVPQSDVPGEETSPTQPFPTKPAPLVIQGALEENLIDYTPELLAEAKELLKQYNPGPFYTPPRVGKPTVYLPGWGGGGNWTGVAFDPETDMIYAPVMSGAPMIMTLTAPDKTRSNLNYVGQFGQPKGPQNLPLFKGPYGKVVAVDLKTGDHAWELPIGDGPIDHPALKDLNLPPLGNFGQSYVTLTKELLFVFASGGGGRGRPSTDEAAAPVHMRAVDKATGEVVHEMSLPLSPSATPMTYMSGGKQYIVVAATGRGKPAELVALALP
jgi:quinoprotein glucose dehydrogenase